VIVSSPVLGVQMGFHRYQEWSKGTSATPDSLALCASHIFLCLLTPSSAIALSVSFVITLPPRYSCAGASKPMQTNERHLTRESRLAYAVPLMKTAAAYRSWWPEPHTVQYKTWTVSEEHLSSTIAELQVLSFTSNLYLLIRY
jgi:hypothetical protein